MGPAVDGAKSNFGKQPNAAKASKATNPVPKKSAAPVEDDGIGIRGGVQPPLALIENETVIGRIRAEDQVPLVRRYTEKTVSFIRDAHAKDRPFFVYLAHNAVHFPLYPSEKFRGSSSHGQLGDWVQEVDWSVGQILDALREQKLDRNTLVLFVSDNGGPMTKRNANASVNTPLRGQKGDVFEGGIRVPFLVSWPARIPAGRTYSQPIISLDILPTALAAAGTTRDAKLAALDGVDLLPFLTGKNTAAPHARLFWRMDGGEAFAVREGNWKWLHTYHNAP
eukprot:gene54771-73185_t